MNSVYRYLQLTAIGLAAVTARGAWGQTNIPPADAAGATNAVAGTNVTDIGTTTVVGHLNQATTQILPNLGATVSVKDVAQIQALAGGDNAQMSQVITRFPGVAEDSAENGDLHVRGE